MNKVMVGVAVLVMAGLTACAPGQMPSRNATDVTAVAVAGQVRTPKGTSEPSVTVRSDYRIRHFSIEVPETLLVSEADVYYPIADIVWHGDAEGDRHAQVKAIFADSFRKGIKGMKGDDLVDVVVQVARFHALTPKTRATLGGDFNMIFQLTVLDAKTGDIIEGPRRIELDVPASGGVQALREEAEGITQKSVISARLQEVFREQLERRRVPASSVEALTRVDFSPSDLTVAQ